MLPQYLRSPPSTLQKTVKVSSDLQMFILTLAFLFFFVSFIVRPRVDHFMIFFYLIFVRIHRLIYYSVKFLVINLILVCTISVHFSRGNVSQVLCFSIHPLTSNL